MIGLLTYKQAVEALRPLKCSVRTLRLKASKKTPAHQRLQVVRLGHRTVGIRPVDLQEWVSRNLQ